MKNNKFPRHGGDLNPRALGPYPRARRREPRNWNRSLEDEVEVPNTVRHARPSVVDPPIEDTV
jgi:hypothetical protein